LRAPRSCREIVEQHRRALALSRQKVIGYPAALELDAVYQANAAPSSSWREKQCRSGGGELPTFSRGRLASEQVAEARRRREAIEAELRRRDERRSSAE
jgi:hypothetical protein